MHKTDDIGVQNCGGKNRMLLVPSGLPSVVRLLEEPSEHQSKSIIPV
jgi:hypothetical protein